MQDFYTLMISGYFSSLLNKKKIISSFLAAKFLPHLHTGLIPHSVLFENMETQIWVLGEPSRKEVLGNTSMNTNSGFVHLF